MVGASFGWSVGDIAQAVKIIVQVTKAFKATGGAASKYEDASGFLQSLKTTLDHLAHYVDLNCSDVYARDILEQLERITSPWNNFKAFISKYEKSLGPSSRQSKLGKAPQTVQYTLKDLSGEVDRLRAAVAQPLQAINTLLSLQQIADIKLVPQKLLTPAQCHQLVEAMSIAGVPKALSDRLESMQYSQEASVLRMQSEMETQFEKICDLQETLRNQQQEGNLQRLVELRVDIDCTKQGDTLNNEEASSSESSMSLRDFRLLVEDQHWGVIKLLRALSQQLDELKRNRSDNVVVLSDRSSTYRGQPRGQISANVTRMAAMLVSTMTTGIVTGVIVGRASAASTLAHTSTHEMAAQVATGFATPHITNETNALGTDSSNSGEHNPLLGKRDRSIRDISSVSSDARVEIRATEMTEKSELSEIENSRPESPQDSVIDADNSSISSNAIQFVGARHEQIVVKVASSSASTRSVLTACSRSRASAPYTKAAVLNAVPECLEIEKDLQAPFFVQGRVFMTIWTAANVEACRTSQQFAEIAYVGANANENLSHAEMRRFLVVRNEGPYSMCVPIYLGRSLGKAKNTIRGPYEIPISMAAGCSSDDTTIEDNVDFKVDPTTANSMACVPNKSYVKLREVCMIDHNVKIADIGIIIGDDLPLLDALWRDANAGQLRSWLIEDEIVG